MNHIWLYLVLRADALADPFVESGCDAFIRTQVQATDTLASAQKTDHIRYCLLVHAGVLEVERYQMYIILDEGFKTFHHFLVPR